MFKKGNKGITLIALVITIIVLLILAGITIAQITGQDSAPEKAAQAKVENERGAAKDAATMLVTEKIQGYYEEKYEKTPATTIAANQLEYIAEKLGSGVTTGDYTVTVTAAGGITVTKGTETLATGTVNDAGVITWDGTVTGGNTDNTSGGPTVVGGIETIQIGDSVNYNPGNLSTASVELPEGAEIENTKLAAVSLPTGATLTSNVTANQATDWKVLDVRDNGDILIMPTKGTLAKLTLNGVDGYNNSIVALNAVSQTYLNPTYAKSARSVTIEDINKVENYSPSGETFSYSWKNEYGMDEDSNIIYGGGITVENTVATPGEEKILRVYTSTPETDEYTYDANSNIFKPLQKDNNTYWIASRCVWLYDNYCNFAVRRIGNPNEATYYERISSWSIVHIGSGYSIDETSGLNNVLPVVYLKSGVTMEKDGNGVWQLSVE